MDDSVYHMPEVLFNLMSHACATNFSTTDNATYHEDVFRQDCSGWSTIEDVERRNQALLVNESALPLSSGRNVWRAAVRVQMARPESR